MLSYHTDTQNPESLPFCIQVRGDRQLTEKHVFNIRAVKTRQARGQRLTGRCYCPGWSLLACLSRMAGRGPFQEEGAERTKTPEAGVGWRVGKPTGGQRDGAEATGPEGEGGCGHWDLRLQNEQVERLARLALAASSNTNES